MNLRLVLLVPLLAAVALSGCRMRGGGSSNVVEDECRSENQRLMQELDAARQRNAQLENRLAMAGEDRGATIGTVIGPVEGFETTSSGGVALPDDFAFAKGSADLNEDGQKAIERLAARLNEGDNANKKVIVKGFTDDTPVAKASTKEKYTDNWGLSGARSAAVVRALEKAGVHSDRLNGAFRGQLDPRAGAGEDKGRNRRVEIYLN